MAGSRDSTLIDTDIIHWSLVLDPSYYANEKCWQIRIMPILLTFYSQFLKIVYKEYGKAESDSWLLLTNSNEALEQLWTVWV